jgi:hypothetical protein
MGKDGMRQLIFEPKKRSEEIGRPTLQQRETHKGTIALLFIPRRILIYYCNVKLRQ